MSCYISDIFPCLGTHLTITFHVGKSFQCMTLQHQLERCKEDIARRDQTIYQLTQENQRLKDQNAKLSESRNKEQTQRKKRNLALQNDVKVIASIVADRSPPQIYSYALDFNHPHNKTVTAAIYTDMCGAHGNKMEYTEEEVQGGCAVYFKSKKKDEQKKINGTFEKHRAQCRSNYRKSQVLEERRKAINDPNMPFTNEEKQLGYDILSLGAAGVSSDEDSDAEDVTDRRKRKRPDSASRVRRIKDFTWQSSRFVEMKNKVDDFYVNSVAKPPHLRVRDTRVRDATGPVSNRKPTKNVKAWMLK